MADYPVEVKTFTIKKDLTDNVLAAHVNDLQTEVVLLENTLGTLITHSPASTPTFNQTNMQNTAYIWSSLRARIENIEAGLLADAHTQYVKNAGGSTITPSSSSTVGLVLKEASGQSVDLLQIKDSSNNVVIKVDSNSDLYVGTEKVATGSSFNPLFLIGC
jgi:hypothetical protein